MSMTTNRILYDDTISLQDLQTHTTINNEKLESKKVIMEKKIKKIKELKLEQSRRQSQAALQSQGQIYWGPTFEVVKKIFEKNIFSKTQYF